MLAQEFETMVLAERFGADGFGRAVEGRWFWQINGGKVGLTDK